MLVLMEKIQKTCDEVIEESSGFKKLIATLFGCCDNDAKELEVDTEELKGISKRFTKHVTTF